MKKEPHLSWQSKEVPFVETYARIGAISGGVAANAIPINVLSINADGISDQAHAFSGRIEKMKISRRPKRPGLPQKTKHHPPQLPSL